VLEEHPDALIIPEAAITYDAKRNPTVEVLDPGAKNGRRSVVITTGVGNGTRTQVTSGLAEGDTIVLPS
jgi:HlyD family secretion protein